MRKPAECIGCRWYGDGEGFVDDEIDPKCALVFIAQNPGEVEEVQGRPLVGITGQMFRGRFVGKHLPGVRCSYANVVKCRKQDAAGRRNNTMPAMNSKEWQEVVEKCGPYLMNNLKKVSNDAVIVPLGEHAARAMTGLKAKNMLHLRGTVVEGEL